MPNLRNGTKGDSNPGSLDCESGILPLSYRAPRYRWATALRAITLCGNYYIMRKLLRYAASHSDTSFSLNMSIGPSVAKPLSICFLVFSVLSNPSKYVSHICMISLSTISIWPSKLFMKGISKISFDLLSLWFWQACTPSLYLLGNPTLHIDLRILHP